MGKNKKEDTLLLDKIAALLFTAIAVFHAWRVLYQTQVRIGLFTVPMGWSLLGIIITGFMALCFWKRIHRASA